MRTYMGVCPCCEGENLTYDAIQFEGDKCYFPRECDDCGAKGQERYNMDFTGHENVEKPILSNNQKEKCNTLKPNESCLGK